MTKILVVDIDEKMYGSLRKILGQEQSEITLLRTEIDIQDLMTKFEQIQPDLVFLNMQMPNLDGLTALRRLKEAIPSLPVIVTADRLSTSDTIKAMSSRAFDCVVKPLDLNRLRDLVQTALRAKASAQRAIYEMQSETREREQEIFVGEHPEMVEIYKMIGRIAPTNVTVLIQGESGTGKELVAREVHRHSLRKNKRFLAVNCAAIPETLLESELFGYERGAFTGAMERRMGKFEQCQGGTIFLDEVADMSKATQSKLLRVLEQREFERLGGTQSIEADVRIIAATNKSLVELTKKGAFRMDLFYRLRGASIYLPPLRERGGDIDLLAHNFLQYYAKESKKDITRISAEAMEKLLAHYWPGNVRELENVIHTAVIYCDGNVLTPEHIHIGEEIPVDYEELKGNYDRMLIDLLISQFAKMKAVSHGTLYDDLVAALEKALITLTMKEVGQNQVQAAKILGISRNTLRDRLKRYKAT